MNLHVANALAALYLALGQDVACVAENAIGIATYENAGKICMPHSVCQPHGRHGGRCDALERAARQPAVGRLRGGQYSSRKLAEIICASALALEISLAGAIVSNEFAEAHAKFGR